MKLTKTHLLSLRIVVLFTVAILSTFLGDYLHLFLGDWKCDGSGKRYLEGIYVLYERCNYSLCNLHDSSWHWGYRHWIYFVMCITLFIIQVVDIINFSSKKLQ